MDKPMMKCGHVANATCEDGKPCCVICNCTEVDTTPINLEGRTARCSCGNTTPSRIDLPFFEHKPDEQYDRYYCGCFGWD